MTVMERLLATLVVAMDPLVALNPLHRAAHRTITAAVVAVVVVQIRALME